jgi:hypothetical protein
MKKILIFTFFFLFCLNIFGQDKKTNEALTNNIVHNYLSDKDNFNKDSLTVYNALLVVWKESGSPKIRHVKAEGIRSHEGGPFAIVWLESYTTEDLFAELAHIVQFRKSPIKYSFQAGWLYGSSLCIAIVKKDGQTLFLRWQDIYTERAYRNCKHFYYEFEAHGYEFKKGIDGNWEWTEATPNLSIEAQIKARFEELLKN